MGTILKFTNIKAWQLVHAFVLVISKTTKQFPKHEQYCLTSQMWRASISVAAILLKDFIEEWQKKNYDSMKFQ